MPLSCCAALSALHTLSALVNFFAGIFLAPFVIPARNTMFAVKAETVFAAGFAFVFHVMYLFLISFPPCDIMRISYMEGGIHYE
jgi:hypothetical protein